MSTHIDICICTFRRTHVVRTLASLAVIERPFDSSIRVIVADNDDDPSAQIMVAQAAESFGLDLTYIHAPARNISIARNACLDGATGDFIAFVDDDEIATPHWLVALMEQQRTHHADITLGPVRAVYETDTPQWIVRGDYHSTRPVWVRNHIITGYTGNVLMRRAAPALDGLRFDERFASLGGEDTDFFSRAHAAGATFDYASTAEMYETISPERANFRWLRQRRLRYGHTHAAQLMAMGKPRIRNLMGACVKAALCFAMVLWSPHHARAWVLRGTFHAGVIAALRQETTLPHAQSDV